MKLLTIGLSIMVICLIACIFAAFTTHIESTEEVPCYDGNNNIIKDSICIKEIYSVDKYFWLFFTFFILGLGIGIVGLN